MTDEQYAAAEARLETFEKNADDLWRMLHDPYLLARHLAELLKTDLIDQLIGAIVVGLGCDCWSRFWHLLTS